MEPGVGQLDAQPVASCGYPPCPAAATAGEPGGVCDQHRDLVGLMLWVLDSIRVGPGVPLVLAANILAKHFIRATGGANIQVPQIVVPKNLRR